MARAKTDECLEDGKSSGVAVVQSASESRPQVPVAELERLVAERTEDLRRTNEALRRSEGSFRRLVESSPDGIFVLQNDRVVYANQARATMMGFSSAEELVGRPISDFLDPEEHEAVRTRISALHDGSQSVNVAEGRLRRRDGTYVDVEVAAIPTVLDGKPAILSAARDLTERKKLTRRMLEMDRMVAMGTIAAGVGHEINNPLAYVIMNLELALERLDEQDKPPGGASWDAFRTEVRGLLDEAHDGAQRIHGVTRDLRSLARAPEDRITAIDLAPVLDSAVRLASHEIRHRARLVRDPAEAVKVRANSRLGQVFLNLLTNAAHSIAEGNADQNRIRIGVEVGQRQVSVSIEDTGCGIAQAKLDAIFDPFYTTKPQGQGLGLGLSICRQIVAQCGGTMQVTSRESEGTVVTVRLDRAEETAEP